MEDLTAFVSELIDRPAEEGWLEFKENECVPAKLGTYISALSNAAALAGLGQGILLWGVRDGSHEVVGTEFDWRCSYKGEPLEHWLARQVSPDVAFAFREGEAFGKRVVVLTVPAAKTVPTSFAGERWTRIGSSREKLSKYPEREAQLFNVLSHGMPTMTNVPSEWQDLTFVSLFTYYAGRGIALREETFRENLRLLTHDGRYNILAQVLSDNSHIPIRFSIFSGTSKADPLYSVREFGNTCLLVSLDKVLEYSDVLNVIQADERDRVVARKDVPLFDKDAWREAVVNAFVHNRWTDLNGPAFSAFSDRIEVLSHGGLPSTQSAEGFFGGRSIPVNPALSDVILQLHISERSGRGVPKIVSAYGVDAFSMDDRSIGVTLSYRRIDAVLPISGPADKGRAVPGKTASAVLAAMRDNPNVTQQALAGSLGLSRAAIAKSVAWLRDNGYIEREGSRKAGWWRVL